ncbi:MAG: CsgE family curli-type amyloid fiber assembly protein [Mariprofundaceae bacterium]|nr:CsgE family curli-type amyloid fiber assembly protein [Mariprofundaceae bacterium]
MATRFKTTAAAFLMMVGLCLQMSPAAFAADASDRMLHKVVIDNTITYPGHEFYRQFVHYLMLETGNVYFDQVTLKEYRSRRSGSSIHIEFAEKTLFHSTVYAGDRSLARKAKRAAKIVSAKISKAPLNALFSQAGDLAADEL